MTRQGRETDYRHWRDIDYRPVVTDLSPGGLVPLLDPGAHVLDVGCGAGVAALFLGRAGMRVLGIDLSPVAISEARAAAVAEGLQGEVEFQLDDFLSSDVKAAFDAVLLIRVLTCLPEVEAWRQMTSHCRRALKRGGLLYVHDFAQDATNPAYADRYIAGERRGWRRGCFEAGGAGAPSFVAYHHDDQAIAELSHPFAPVSMTFHSGRSMTGNQVRMFEFIGRVR